MPIYEFRVQGEDTIVEMLCPLDAPREIVSSTGRVATRIVSSPARTAGLWGDTNQREHYDRGLKRWVSGDREAEKIARSRGLVPMRELGTERETDDLIEKYTGKLTERHRRETGEWREYDANLTKFEGDSDRAAAETWSASRILHDDTIYSSTPKL